VFFFEEERSDMVRRSKGGTGNYKADVKAFIKENPYKQRNLWREEPSEVVGKVTIVGYHGKTSEFRGTVLYRASYEKKNGLGKKLYHQAYKQFIKEGIKKIKTEHETAKWLAKEQDTIFVEAEEEYEESLKREREPDSDDEPASEEWEALRTLEDNRKEKEQKRRSKVQRTESTSTPSTLSGSTSLTESTPSSGSRRGGRSHVEDGEEDEAEDAPMSREALNRTLDNFNPDDPSAETALRALAGAIASIVIADRKDLEGFESSDSNFRGDVATNTDDTTIDPDKKKLYLDDISSSSSSSPIV
jgi:hypothetical protein